MAPSLKQIINNSLVAIFQCRPAPRNFTESLLIYRKLSELGDLIQYRASVCPITKKRTGDIRVIYNDHDTTPDTSRVSYRTAFKIRSKAQTPLEKQLANLNVIEASEPDYHGGETRTFKLGVQLISRNQESLSRARTLANSSYFRVKGERMTLNEMDRSINTRKDEVLKGFKGLFDGVE